MHRSQAKTGLMKDYHIYNSTDVYGHEANYFASQLLIADADFLDCAAMKHTYAMIAAELNLHEELTVIKGDILKRQGYKLDIPYVPKTGYLGKR